jgi:hypothetical protein
MSFPNFVSPLGSEGIADPIVGIPIGQDGFIAIPTLPLNPIPIDNVVLAYEHLDQRSGIVHEFQDAVHVISDKIQEAANTIVQEVQEVVHVIAHEVQDVIQEVIHEVSPDKIQEVVQEVVQEVLQEVVQDAPAVVQDAPVVVQDEPAVVQDEPAVVQDEPAVVQDEPVVVQDAPAVVQDAPAVVQDAPAEKAAARDVEISNVYHVTCSRGNCSDEGSLGNVILKANAGGVEAVIIFDVISYVTDEPLPEFKVAATLFSNGQEIMRIEAPSAQPASNDNNDLNNLNNLTLPDELKALLPEDLILDLETFSQ